MKCNNCECEHDGSYGSGRFCSLKCARGFSTKAKRKEIAKKISLTLTGRNMTPEQCLKISKNHSKYWNGKSRKKYHDEHPEKRQKSIDSRRNTFLLLSKVIDNTRSCKFCSGPVFHFKTVCESCKFESRILYRHECDFKFKIEDYPEYFDLSLIEKYGRYSPRNKGNNLNGISKDHLLSINDGFKNKIDPKIISHPANCILRRHKENQSKGFKSFITLNELLKRIEEFNLKYGWMTE